MYTVWAELHVQVFFLLKAKKSLLQALPNEDKNKRQAVFEWEFNGDHT